MVGRSVDCGNQGVGCVVDPGDVDEGEAGADQWQASCFRPIDQTLDQLGIAWSDHQMGANRDDGHGIGRGS